MGRMKGEGGLYWSDSRQRWVAAWRGRKRYATTQREAAAKLAALKKAEGLQFATVGDLLDWWTGQHLPARIADGALTESTVHDYRHSAALWAPLRHTRIEKLTAADIDRRLEQLRTVKTMRGTGYSASKRRGALVALRRAFKAARRAGLIPRGRTAPEDALTPTVRAPAQPAVTPQMAQAVLAELADYRYLPAVIVTLTLGLRISETLGLVWDDIDLDTGTIRIHRQLRRTKAKTWELAPTKGKNDETLALPHAAGQTLRSWRAQQATERLAAGGYWRSPIDDLVFRTEFGDPCWASSISNTVAAACDTASTPQLPIPRMRIHTFARHGHATLIRLQGATLDQIREQLRHTQPSTTIRYAHVLPQVRRDTAALIDDALGSSN